MKTVLKKTRKPIAMLLAVIMIMSLAMSASAVLYAPSWDANLVGKCTHNGSILYAYSIFPDEFAVNPSFELSSCASVHVAVKARIWLTDGQTLYYYDYNRTGTGWMFYYPPSNLSIIAVSDFTLTACNLRLILSL